MSTAVLDASRTFLRSECHQDLGQLLESLGGIPAERIRLWPPPGAATLEDLIAFNESQEFAATCELIDGTLVELPFGFDKSRATIFLTAHCYMWNQTAKLGFLCGVRGIVKLLPTRCRAADLSFFLWNRFPDHKRPAGSIFEMFPDFAVVILSESNTENELKMKRAEFFAAGTRLMWEADLKMQTVVVYREPYVGTTFGIDDVLDGGDILPGFNLSIREWMESLFCDEETDD